MLNVILLGPPGSGKGTQAELIVKHINLSHISTGDCLRKEIAGESEIGIRVKEIIAAGILVPDDIVNEMIAKYVEANKLCKGLLFDGYPRTAEQAMYLDTLLDSLNIPVTVALNINVPDDELVRRIVKRGEISNRPDDTFDVAKSRIQVYNAQTLPLLDYYSQQGKLTSVNGFGTIDETFELIRKELK